MTALAAVAALTTCAALSGCNRGISGLIPVSGKLTYKGGAWPKKGEIIFSPAQKTADRPLMPAMAHILEDGSFAVQTYSSFGMAPGEYYATIRCWLEAPDERSKGTSAVPQRYGSPRTSGLKVTVPEGSGPIVLNWDIPAT